MDIIDAQPTDFNDIYEEEATLLADLVPDDLALYKHYFTDFCPKTPFYTKPSYDEPFFQKNKKTGKPLPAYPDLLATMLEKHLDYHRYAYHYQVHDTSHFDQYIRHDDRHFWFGLLGGKKTSLECLDIDNKETEETKKLNIVGWYRITEPLLPVVRCSLAYIRRLKAVYDNFPGRIWCISSDTLGIHAWRKCDLTALDDLQKLRTKESKALGLSGIEVHPMSGRCLRRPFGAGYRTITPTGILTDWIEQLHHFHRPEPTPSFATILRAIRDVSIQQMQAWQRWGDAKGGRVNIAPLVSEWHEVHQWLSGKEPAPKPKPQKPILPIRPPKPAFDLDTMRHGRWPLELERLANDGLPHSGSVGPVCYELAKWLLWVEQYDEPETLRLLWEFVQKKHNNTISRMQSNPEQVYQQIERCVKMAKMEKDTELFARIRQKRSQGQYQRLIYLAPILEGKDISSPSSFRLLICLSSLEEELPREICSIIEQSAGRMKIVKFATKLLNFLWQHGGSANISAEKLCEFLGYKNHSQTQKYKKHLVDIGLLKQGAYSAGRFSRLYSLTREAKEMFMEREKEKRQLA